MRPGNGDQLRHDTAAGRPARRRRRPPGSPTGRRADGRRCRSAGATSRRCRLPCPADRSSGPICTCTPGRIASSMRQVAVAVVPAAGVEEVNHVVPRLDRANPRSRADVRCRPRRPARRSPPPPRPALRSRRSRARSGNRSSGPGRAVRRRRRSTARWPSAWSWQTTAAAPDRRNVPGCDPAASPPAKAAAGRRPPGPRRPGCNSLR